jgi:hypothetical protein
MSLGQWVAIANTHTKANGGNKPEAPTDEEFEAAIIRAREITDGK